MKKIRCIVIVLVLSCIVFCGCSNGSEVPGAETKVIGKLVLDINDKGRFGFIDETGKTIIDHKYYYAEPFSDGLALVEVNSGYGFIDKNGKMCIPAKFEIAHSFSDGLALVVKDNKYEYINKKGNIAFEMNYSDAYSFSEGMARVANTRGEGEMGYIDTTGKLVVPCIYDYTTSFSEGLAGVKKDGVFRYIDKTGKVVLDIGEDFGSPFSEGLASVGKRSGADGWGFIDKSGNEVIPCEYRSTAPFSDSFAVVRSGEKYDYIDKNGEVKFGGYYEAGEFYNGYAIVNNGNYAEPKIGIIDKENNVVVPFDYKDISFVIHDDTTGVVVYSVCDGEDEGYSYTAINLKGLRNFDIPSA